MRVGGDLAWGGRQKSQSGQIITVTLSVEMNWLLVRWTRNNICESLNGFNHVVKGFSKN